MDAIEANARKQHGDFLYRQTWLASSTNAKWRWGVVAAVVLGKFFLSAALVCSLFLLLVKVVSFFDAQNFPNFGGADIFATFVAAVITWIGIEVSFGSRFISAASSFYSIAADMVRMNSKKKIVRIAYLASGSLAVAFAAISWWMRGSRLEKFTVTELDVLGTIFSRAGFWKPARAIFEEIKNLLTTRASEGDDEKQNFVSFAFACKWSMLDPEITEKEKSLLRLSICHVLVTYAGELSPEVKARLYDALGDKEREQKARKAIAAKLS